MSDLREAKLPNESPLSEPFFTEILLLEGLTRSLEKEKDTLFGDARPAMTGVEMEILRRDVIQQRARRTLTGIVRAEIETIKIFKSGQPNEGHDVDGDDTSTQHQTEQARRYKKAKYIKSTQKFLPHGTRQLEDLTLDLNCKMLGLMDGFKSLGLTSSVTPAAAVDEDVELDQLMATRVKFNKKLCALVSRTLCQPTSFSKGLTKSAETFLEDSKATNAKYRQLISKKRVTPTQRTQASAKGRSVPNHILTVGTAIQ